MKASIFVGVNQPVSVEETTPIAPGPNDVVVRLGASGVCHSDLSVVNGTLGFAPPSSVAAASASPSSRARRSRGWNGSSRSTRRS